MFNRQERPRHRRRQIDWQSWFHLSIIIISNLNFNECFLHFYLNLLNKLENKTPRNGCPLKRAEKNFYDCLARWTSFHGHKILNTFCISFNCLICVCSNLVFSLNYNCVPLASELNEKRQQKANQWKTTNSLLSDLYVHSTSLFSIEQ